MEDGESLIDSTIREVKEETGLMISNLEPCGVIYWFNNETGEKFLFLIIEQKYLVENC